MASPEGKPWEMNGKKGIAYKTTIRFNNEIFELKSDKQYADLLDKDAMFDIGLKKKDNYVQLILENGVVAPKI